MGLLHHRGTTAQALLTELVSFSSGNYGTGQSTSGHSVYRIRVEPGTGHPFESELSLRGYMGLSGSRLVGRWIQVTYDPKSTAKCKIDKAWVKALPSGVLMAMSLREEPNWPDNHSTRRVHTNVGDLMSAGLPATGQPERSKGSPASLAQVAELDAQGALTDTEFAAAKTDLLG